MNELIRRVIHEIPDYSRFYTIDELDDSSRALASEFSDLVSLSTVGHSRDGHPILMIRIGSGPRRALFVGCPHPNEPFGAVTLEYLSRKLCEEPALLQELGHTFYIIKAIDVDGYRLNEGWLPGPYTPDRYILGYYRPAPDEQVEWTFPYHYKTLHFDKPLPETRAFMKAIDEARPHFLNSLHNFDRGGTFFYLTEALSVELYQQLRKLATDYGLPLLKGEAEARYIPQLDEAIFRMPKRSEVYDYFESRSPGEDPAKVMEGGASSLDYANTRYGTFCFISEVTHFYDYRMSDTTLTERLLREALLDSTAQNRERFSFLRGQYEQALPFMTVATRLETAFSSFLKMVEKHLSSESKLAETDPSFNRLATVAEQFDLLMRDWWFSLSLASMLVRAIDVQPTSTELMRIHAKTKKWLNAGLEDLVRYLNWDMRSIRELCAVQLGSALLIMEHLRGMEK